MSLFREYAKSFNVLIPYRAYSAATLLALGADEIVMHPFAELGPIDPTVSNIYNPTDARTGQLQGISVEDVKAYVNFIKTTVGITHEDELVLAIKALTDKVHPLALGNVERFLAQSRMIAKKILRTHMSEAEDHNIQEIVENMASKLYFHGHPINRKEAKDELHLKVNLEPPPALESAMWDLYKDYEAEFKNLEVFFPAGDLAALPAPAPQIQMTPQGAVQLPAQPVEKEYHLTHAMIESRRLSNKHTTHRRFRLFAGAPAQPVIQEDILAQGWKHSVVQSAQPASQQQHSTSAVGAPAASVAAGDRTGQQIPPGPAATDNSPAA